MNKNDDAFLSRLLETFRVEAQEHLQAMARGLMELEKAPPATGQGEILESVFREAHSLKGAARAVNLAEVEARCQSLESELAALKRGELELTPALFDRLHKALDALDGLVRPRGDKAAAPRRPPQPDPAGLERPSQERLESMETVRVRTARLNALLGAAEELVSAKLALAEPATGLRDLAGSLAAWKTQRAKAQPFVRDLERDLGSPDRSEGRFARGDGHARAPARKMLEFIEWSDNALKSAAARLATLQRQVDQDLRALSQLTDNLLEEMRRVMMLPFSSLLQSFPKLVRDLARESGKDVRLSVEGAEIEADRRILEEIKDPLIHLLRNGVDHGIESPAERERKKKPPGGTIALAMTPKNGGKVEISVSDDGAGIDTGKVRAAAVHLGLVSSEEAEKLPESAVVRLVFHSGVSTSPIITDISGRGLGLAIVREKVERLGGAVSVETGEGRGTVFRLVLALTLATFRGVLVEAGGQLFVFPAVTIARVLRVSQKEIRTVENRETLSLDGAVVPLVGLAAVLGVAERREARESRESVRAVVVSAEGRRLAFHVDEVLHEQEVLVKAFGRRLARVPGVAGAAVLGTGRVVPVLNVASLITAAARLGPVRATPAALEAKPQPVHRSVLVAEDSITARTLLKNILESAGFSVKTAVDGVDAYTTLRTEKFDVLVTDVDMPRMNGFDLTARVRADKKLADLPVVLVTALESRQDRERGIDVGANAYIVKSSFDQSNLLEVIRRLI